MAEQPVLGFAGLLRQLRVEARLTQEELAQAAGLSPRSVSDLERGINRTARKDTAVLLAGALGLAEPVVALFVAAARGRAPVAEVHAVMRAEAAAAAAGRLAPGGALAWSQCPYPGLMPFGVHRGTARGGHRTCRPAKAPAGAGGSGDTRGFSRPGDCSSAVAGCY
jgi:transcriptional regulator with XRE-family HTH domain